MSQGWQASADVASARGVRRCLFPTMRANALCTPVCPRAAAGVSGISATAFCCNAEAVERLACSCEGCAPLFQRQATSCAFRTTCIELAPHATPTRTSTQHSYNPSSISSSRCESDTAVRFGGAAPPVRRGRFRNRGAASSGMSSAGALPPPFRSLNSRRKDIAAPRSAAADDGRPKVSMVYPALGGGRRGACPFRRGFFAGRRDDGAAGAGAGASSAASVGGAGVAAPDKVWFSDPKTSSSLCLCDSAPDLPLLIDDGASSGAMSAKSLVSLASHFPALPRRVLPHASIRGP